MSSTTFLIFDLDGTISDNGVGIGRSMNYALEHFGYSAVSEAELRQYIGPPLDDAFRSITGNASSEHVAALVVKYRERYGAVGYAENTVYPGIPEVLQTLASGGCPIGLCTSKRADFAERILHLFGIRQYFSFISGGDIGVKKQQQLASLLADSIIGLGSTMIGDRALDIHAAKANGLGSIGVLWGYGSLAELQAASPEGLFERVDELLRLGNPANLPCDPFVQTT
jgi:phosphoglycolate phosphatase